MKDKIYSSDLLNTQDFQDLNKIINNNYNDDYIFSIDKVYNNINDLMQDILKNQDLTFNDLYEIIKESIDIQDLINTLCVDIFTFYNSGYELFLVNDKIVKVIE